MYHTFTYFVPPWVFARGLKSTLRSARPVCYELHAADLLDFASDAIHPRMERHPGMRVSFAQKRTALREILASIEHERRIATYKQTLDEGLVISS